MSIADPKGFISRIKSALHPKCLLKQLPFCEEVIALRLSGVSYRKITLWLSEKGETRITESTLSRVLSKAMSLAKLPEEDFVPFTVLFSEKLGGRFTTNVVDELDNLIFLQRRRINYLVKMEEVKRSQQPGYMDYRLMKEMMFFASLLSQVSDNSELSSPEKTITESVHIDQETSALLEELIISGKIVPIRRGV